MPNLLVHAKGVGNCSEYGEEGVSDEMGNFRIWALKSYVIFCVFGTLFMIFMTKFPPF